ncbi:MAG TPA: (5-formylfuran-3-yl)methyl phosphate synthase [Ramlibacter sp.]|uniref:(5-formylfuran-3-yl)methyl phosphate synthase n=1 Tax=Ramlibacter sp. TaxID=1917967 RepID=UPI002ED1B20D
MMVRLLVSVRDVDEALAAAGAGADLIDLKEPADGALGGLAPERIARIVSVLRTRYPGLPISATVGDLPAEQADEILRRVGRVASRGVDYVKVGLWPTPEAPGRVTSLLDALADRTESIVPVLLVDEGLDAGLVDHALARGSFPGLMVDTATKRGGSLLQRVPAATLASFVAAVRSRGMLAGLAGSLRMDDAAALLALAPDFAGFRGAVTRGGRAGVLDPLLVRQLRGRFAAGAGAGHGRLATA